MRKLIIFTLTVACAGIQTPERAQAGAFATEFTQLLNNAQLVMSYLRQGQQLVNELNMYADMVRNVKNIPNQVFGPIQADLNALAQIVQGGRALAYSLGNLDVQFRNTFRGYRTTPTAYYTNYKNWSQTSLDTTLGTLRAAGLQGQQLQSEQANHHFNPKYVQNRRWPYAGAQCNEPSRRAAGPAAYEASRVDARGHVKQAGLSSRHDPAAIGERSGNGMVFLHRPGDKQRRHLLAWALMVLMVADI